MPLETNFIERRYAAAGLRVERQKPAEGEPSKRGKPKIVGHAAIFDTWTTLYEGRYWTWREVIKPGAFAAAIKEEQDVRSLFNHDPNFVLGRTKSGSLHLEEDATGLLTRTEPPNTPTIRDLVIAPIERGDITGMSFGWLPRKGDKVVRTEGDDGTVTIDSGGLVVTFRHEDDRLVEEWEVRAADLFDISPVTYPAYEGTDVALRSRPDLRALIAEKDRPHVRTVATPLRNSFRAWLDSPSPATPLKGKSP